MIDHKKKVILTVIIAVLLLTAVCIALMMLFRSDSEPVGSISTDGYVYEIHDTQLTATHGGQRDIIYEADRIGAVLTAAVSSNRVYLLCDDVLYSMDADGGNLYRIATKCYNPGELAGTVTDAKTEELRTLWYYNGNVYFIEYGSTSKLRCFEVGGHSTTVLCKDKVSAFTISTDGMLCGYGKADNIGERQVTYEKDLNQ